MREKISFRSLMIHNEYKALKGKYHSTTGYLFVILFIAFLAFGFAKSTLDCQQKLSADPFSNWINFNYHSGTRDSLLSLNEKTRSEIFREKFHIRGAYFYNRGMVSVAAISPGILPLSYEARTIDPRSDVVKDLLKTGVCAKYFPDSVENGFDCEPNGVVISKKLLDDTGLDKRTLSFIGMKSPVGDLVPVPVLAVVNELPDQADIVYTSLFYCKTMNEGFYDRQNSCFTIFVENMDTSAILRVLKELYVAFEIRDPSAVQTTRLKTLNTAVMNWKIEIGKQENGLPVSLMNKRMNSMVALKNHHFGRYYTLSKDTSCDNSAFFHDYLAVEFKDLEKISSFSAYLTEKLRLQINLEVLSDRENFLYTGNLALGSIILLMFLSITSVSIYLSGVIRNHLLKIKKSLGNFLAFGVKNTTLTWLYIRVTLKILATALFPALALAWACGELFEKYLLGKFLVMNPRQDYFSLTNSWFAIFLLLILCVAVLRTFISVTKILKHTPGDLIYERDCRG